MQLALALIYIAVTGAVLFCMAALLFRGGKSHCNWMYVNCMATVVLWCSSQILQMMAKTRGELMAAFLILAAVMPQVFNLFTTAIGLSAVKIALVAEALTDRKEGGNGA